MTISDAADASGVSAKLVRYYEGIGLIRAALRTEAGYRVYTDADVQTLRFIKRARSLGFGIKAIERLLALWHDRTRASAEVHALALAHVAELEDKIHELYEMAETCGGLRLCVAMTRGLTARSSQIWTARRSRANPTLA
jgi:Cu(I)-responsive transcriptional regulator